MESNDALPRISLGQPTSQVGVTYHPHWDSEDLPANLYFTLVGLCRALGLPQEEEYAKTPARSAKWFQSFARRPDYEGERQSFLNVSFPSQHQALVWEEGLSFVSLCPHHLLPYAGSAAIAYIPNGGVVGISKLARALEYWTHYPVKQEDATSNLADALMKYIKPQPLGVMVILKAKHACMAFRGVEQQDHITGTSAVRGCFESDPSGARSEFLRLANL